MLSAADCRRARASRAGYVLLLMLRLQQSLICCWLFFHYMSAAACAESARDVGQAARWRLAA